MKRLASVATVALAAVLSAAFVAVAPVQAQGMTSSPVRLAATEAPKTATAAAATAAVAKAKPKSPSTTPSGA